MWLSSSTSILFAAWLKRTEFCAVKDDIFFFQLNTGALLYSVDLGSGPEAIAASGQVVNDADWHTVAVSRRGLEVTLVVDESSFSRTLLGTELTLDIDPSGIFAGGRPVAGGIAGNYTGCLQVRSMLPKPDSWLLPWCLSSSL